MILAGDIGGTKVQLALFKRAGRKVARVALARFPSRKYASLEEVLREFLEGRKAKIDRACFGIAGPVVDGESVTPNLPWRVQERRLRRILGVRKLRLLNDLEAMAFAVPHLGPRDCATLHDADGSRTGNLAVIAAGTGLGQAVLHWDGERYDPYATEAGHADFAPRNRDEIDLLAYLQQEFERVSYERVLSGPGLHRIYRFLRDTGRAKETRALARAIADGDPSAVISNTALEGREPICVKALRMFVSLYGAEAGNLALRALAVGGIFIGGGIAPKILPALREGTFLRSFFDKGRMRPLLEGISVHVIRNQRAPLLGAALFATKL